MIRRKPRLHDVVFYAPSIGSMVSSSSSLPPGGAETQIFALATHLARSGVRVAIVVYGKRADVPREMDGVTLVPRPLGSNRRLVGKAVEALRIWRALRRVPRAAIVYRSAGLSLGMVALYARLTQRELIFSTANIADFDPSRLIPRSRDRRLYEFGVRHADAVVVQTEEQIPLCEQRFRKHPRLIKSLSSVSEGPQRSPEAFLWVGRLVSYKRPLDYIELARRVPDARFWMVGVPTEHLPGDAAVAEETFALARDVPNLELLAPRSRSGLQRLMARAVASVSTAEFEGMPNVLLEAWAKGIPALVLRHDPGGVVAEYGLGGFADGSLETFASLARAQWDSRESREELAQRCRDYIEANHSPVVILDQWREVLDLPEVSSEPVSANLGTRVQCAG